MKVGTLLLALEIKMIKSEKIMKIAHKLANLGEMDK